MREKVLRLLEASEDYISGEVISKELSISRQSVSKHISKLNDMGYDIESKHKKGYKYIKNHTLYNKYEIEKEVDGFDIIFLDSVDSTNDYAKKIAKDRTVIIANTQTKGRGRLGRTWYSEKDKGVYMSIILKPDIMVEEAPKLTLLSAAAMLITLRKLTDLDIKIKWPNDLVLKHKKLAGILTEMSLELGQINYIVVGIGVNVGNYLFPDEIKEKGIYLQKYHDVSRKDIVIEFLKEFDHLYQKFLKGDFKKVIEISKEYSVILNKDIKIISKEERIVRAVDIDEKGHLIIVNEQGERENIFYGEVSIRGLYDYVD